ncbi:uncharacterized protein LOC126749209 [Anthonomus grandis grandis]|uniref:uncharacterized protein LOC126749209 n=1 Tax=Anthonomus grandis grandis TaxID=2921223 RepID=UPI002165FA60|nr:uncharacterized protein LOC126749209 [Anthonomus grandis grandis]
MNRIITFLPLCFALSCALSVPSNQQRFAAALRREKLLNQLEELAREKHLYQRDLFGTWKLFKNLRKNTDGPTTEEKRCANFGGDGCAIAGVPGAASDDEWLTEGFNPGKRCANFGDDSCANGGVPGASSDSDWINGGFSPGKRCANFGDEGCANGGIPGASSDSDWIDGGFSPGKRR